MHPHVGVNRLIAAELPPIDGNSYSVVLITTNQSVSMATPKEEWAITGNCMLNALPDIHYSLYYCVSCWYINSLHCAGS